MSYDLMYLYQLSEDNSDFSDTKTLTLGKGKKYFVTKNSVPYLTAEVEMTSNPFDEACIFGKYLCIGIFEKIAFVDLETLNVRYDELERFELYFGRFDIIYNDMLFISSGSGITAYDRDLNVIWKNSNLAVDGVCIYGISDDGKYLKVSCELDPPGGWVDKKVDISTGIEL